MSMSMYPLAGGGRKRFYFNNKYNIQRGKADLIYDSQGFVERNK